MVADIEELEKMDPSEIHTGRLNAKEVLTPKNGENYYMPDRRWKSKTIWRRSGSENIHLDRDSPDRGEEQENLSGESDESSPPLQDSSADHGEARNAFWSVSGNLNFRHHVEHRVKQNVPREEPRRQFENRRRPRTNRWSGERLTKKQTTSSPITCGQREEQPVRCSAKKSKSGLSRNQSSTAQEG